MFEEVTPAEVQDDRKRGELWQVLDVREAWELDIARVDGALHIPMSDVPARLDELDPDGALAVLCHSGGRSARVAAFLVERGFRRVANVIGGIDAWSQEVDSTIPRY